MAWYYGTYSCGHEGRVNITGPGKDRGWKIERRFSGLCPECYKKQMETEREKENEESRKISEEMNLPELTGTPKQIAWANTLRLEALNKFHEEAEHIRSRKKKTYYTTDDEERISLKDVIDDMENALVHITDATFWINYRTAPFGVYIREAYDIIKDRDNTKDQEGM